MQDELNGSQEFRYGCQACMSGGQFDLLRVVGARVCICSTLSKQVSNYVAIHTGCRIAHLRTLLESVYQLSRVVAGAAPASEFVRIHHFAMHSQSVVVVWFNCVALAFLP